MLLLVSIPFSWAEDEEDDNDYDYDSIEERNEGDDSLLVETQDSPPSLNEGDRLIEYNKRNYTWPIQTYRPNTEGWKRIHERRFRQIERMEDVSEKWQAWVTAIGSAHVIPNFTETGWGLTRAPDHVIQRLRNALHFKLKQNILTEEGGENAIGGDLRPLFFPNDILNNWVLDELHPLHEAWAGVELVGNNAYGLRVYRNGSDLLMHVDQTNTHVISCILHIDHSEDSEPWPLVIEDFHGNTNEVFLESGDLLFYESSKCLHGRPRTFNGSWYSSIFVHYYPRGWDTTNFNDELTFAVPPHWAEEWNGEEDNVEQLMIEDVAWIEPDCDDGWCALKDSKKWSVATELGQVHSPRGKVKLPLHPASVVGDEL